MGSAWAFLIGIEQAQSKHIPGALTAGPSLRRLAALLEPLGYTADHRILLLDAQATHATILSRLRLLCRRLERGDILLIALVGTAINGLAGTEFLPFDAQPDDLGPTTIPLCVLREHLEPLGLKRCLLLLDWQPLADDSPWSPAQLRLDLGDWPAVVLSAGLPDERPCALTTPPERGWLHLLANALDGHIPDARTTDGVITVGSLQKWLDLEFPRLLRKHFPEPPKQTPFTMNIGIDQTPLFDLRPLLERRNIGLGGLAGLKRLLLRGETVGKIKELSGFHKSHRLPDQANAAARKYVARIAEADIRADLDSAFERAREAFEYKRKDLEIRSERDEAVGYLRTPDFDYTLTLEVDAEEPTQVRWIRELTRLQEPALLQTPQFDTAFGLTFDELILEFEEPLGLSALIDQLEESPLAGVKLKPSADGHSCELTFTGNAGSVRLEERRIILHAGRGRKAADLLKQFLEFRAKLRTTLPALLPQDGSKK